MDQREHPEYYCWVVAYIDSAHLDLVDNQLKRFPEYQEVEAYIPTVNILKKKFKGVEHFDKIPLLFNYGFFKIPRKYAIHQEYLEMMQKNISAIYGWVRDPARPGGNISVATASAQEISELIRASIDIGAHSAEDLGMIKSGEIIILKGYPFDEVEAIFIKVDEKRKKVLVKIPILWNKEVEVSIDNVFFTVYHGKAYDPEITTRNSLDAMGENQGLDKLTHKLRKNENPAE